MYEKSLHMRINILREDTLYYASICSKNIIVIRIGVLNDSMGEYMHVGAHHEAGILNNSATYKGE